jgi:hypothetical protein
VSDWVEVVIPVGNVKFPPLCPGCLSTTCDSSVVISARSKSLECEVPHCGRCAKRVLRWSRYRQLFLALAILLPLLAAGSTAGTEWLGGALAATAIGISVLWFGLHAAPSLGVSRLPHGSALFRFRSAAYARSFLEFNGAAFEPPRRWRLAKALKRWGRPALTFVAAYVIYLGVVVPIAHVKFAQLVPWLGVVVACAITYFLHFTRE